MIKSGKASGGKFGTKWTYKSGTGSMAMYLANSLTKSGKAFGVKSNGKSGTKFKPTYNERDKG